MTRKIKIADLKRFDITEHLDSEDAIAEYLTIVLEENDPVLLAAALGDVARARGMTQLAKDTGLSRESLYKGLSGDRIPSADTLLKVIHALGLRLVVTPEHACA
ncbi:MAG: putative addiction module antidote protein [Zoogloeaceae bacterium]|jgi:probable addiction module antidote protein|nr:putative addiction module antidote protein [Zoogloeaceae bacterium]